MQDLTGAFNSTCGNPTRRGARVAGVTCLLRKVDARRLAGSRR